MECRLPAEKVRDLRTAVTGVKAAKKVRLKAVQSLLGKLNFACRIVPMGRVFARRLATAGVRSPAHFVRITKAIRDDLEVWDQFLQHFNGRALVMERVASNGALQLFTDAVGSAGFGAVFRGHWCVGQWPQAWRESGLVRNLALLELFPIVVAVELWGSHFAGSKVCFHCDNQAVVHAINNLSAKSEPVVVYLRHLVLRCLQLNVQVVARHVPGVDNEVADALSRFQFSRFRALLPWADEVGVECPEDLWHLVRR
ncbi:uncharacterized protein ACNLHF_027451 [Anomaloglossus baeobatrachus]